MSISDASSDFEWKEFKMDATKLTKKEQHQSDASKPKYSQKFCDKWLEIFHPWLSRYDDDSNKPFCRACQCRLDCNRCHLQRHERTSKHTRNLEILLKKGERGARQNLSIRQERSKYYQQRKKLSSSHDASELGMDTAEDIIEEFANSDNAVPVGKTEPDSAETLFQFVQTDAPSGENYTEENILKQETMSVDGHGDPLPTGSSIGATVTHRSPGKEEDTAGSIGAMKSGAGVSSAVEGGGFDGAAKKDRMKLFMQIQKDRNDLMDSFKEIMSGTGSFSIKQSPPREKNHVDLFFESVSSSVKALSPKLIAETKMRVSQLICELELRALTESDHNTMSSAGVVGSSSGGTVGVVVTPEAAGTMGTAFVINQPVVHKSAEHQVESVQHYQGLS